MPERRCTLLALGLTATLLAAACSSSAHVDQKVDGISASATPPTCTVTMPAGTALPVTVTVAESFDTQAATAAAALVTRFNDAQTQVKVVLEPQTSNDAVQHQLAASQPSASTPAVVVLDDISTRAAADSGRILPAATCMKAAGTDESAFLPSARAYYTVDGHQLAASANLTAPILYFDRTAFKASGLDPAKPPLTLDEVYDDALKLKAADPSTKPLAMTMSSWWVESWLTGAGNAIVNNDNGRSKPADGSTFSSDHAVAVHQWLQKMYSAGLLDAVPDIAGQHTQYLDLATRHSAMLIDSSSGIQNLDVLMSGTLLPQTLGQPAGTVLPPPGPPLDIDAAPWPGLQQAGRGQVSGSVWYLTNTTTPAVQAAAWKFLTWWNDTAQQVQWNLTGSFLPFNTKAVNDPRLERVWQNSRRGHWLDTAYTEITDYDQQSPGPLIGPYAAVRGAIVQSMSNVTSGAMDPQITVTETDQNIEEVLVEYSLAHS